MMMLDLKQLEKLSKYMQNVDGMKNVNVNVNEGWFFHPAHLLFSRIYDM